VDAVEHARAHELDADAGESVILPLWIGYQLLPLKAGTGCYSGFNTEPTERHKELVRKMAKLHFEEEQGKPAMAWGTGE
jgi:hypothetical protein